MELKIICHAFKGDMVAVNEGIEGREEAQGVSRWAVLGMLGLPNLLQIRSENLFQKNGCLK